MRSIQAKLAATAVAAALILSPTAAAASSFSAPAGQAQSAWVTFSQMTPAGAAALASSGAVAAAPDAATMAAAAAAAQPDEGGGSNAFPLPVIGVLLAVLGTAIYIGLIEHHHGHITIPGPPPVSPS